MSEDAGSTHTPSSIPRIFPSGSYSTMTVLRLNSKTQSFLGPFPAPKDLSSEHQHVAAPAQWHPNTRAFTSGPLRQLGWWILQCRCFPRCILNLPFDSKWPMLKFQDLHLFGFCSAGLKNSLSTTEENTATELLQTCTTFFSFRNPRSKDHLHGKHPPPGKHCCVQNKGRAEAGKKQLAHGPHRTSSTLETKGGISFLKKLQDFLQWTWAEYSSLTLADN